MRIHSDVLTTAQIGDSLTDERIIGRIAHHVTFKKLQPGHSRVKAHGFEIQLEASERDSGRRAGNSGSYGAMRPEQDGYAATFDEWGWLLAALYAKDPAMIVGASGAPTYLDAEDFDAQTGLTYNPAKLLDALQTGRLDPYPFTQGRSLIGRRGANRLSAKDGYLSEQRGWPVKFVPRTVEWVREFAHLDAQVTP